jgi:hypothetical protein
MSNPSSSGNLVILSARGSRNQVGAADSSNGDNTFVRACTADHRHTLRAAPLLSHQRENSPGCLVPPPLFPLPELGLLPLGPEQKPNVRQGHVVGLQPLAFGSESQLGPYVLHDPFPFASMVQSRPLGSTKLVGLFNEYAYRLRLCGLVKS